MVLPHTYNDVHTDNVLKLLPKLGQALSKAKNDCQKFYEVSKILQIRILLVLGLK